MNYAALEQQRKAIHEKIQSNKEVIVIWRKAMVSDGFDGMVDDPYGTSTAKTIVCRISQLSRGPEGYGPNAAGFDVVGSWSIHVDWQTEIYEGDVFEARDRKWRIGPVQQIKRYGGVIEYEAPLIEAETIQEVGT